MSRPTIDEVPKILADDPDMICVAPDERYVVLYAVSCDPDTAPSPRGIEIHSARDAAHRALELTRDERSGESVWSVYDTVTKQWSTFAQSDIERP